MLILAIPAVLVLGACSSSDDDEPDTTTPQATVAEDTPSADTESRPTLPDFSVPSIPDLSIPDLSIPDLSDLTIPGNAEEAARDMLEGLGLDDEQIDCLVDRIEEVGGPANQLSDIMGLLGDCDISISDIQPGG